MGAGFGGCWGSPFPLAGAFPPPHCILCCELTSVLALPCPALQAEIGAESGRVCKFIIDREIEAPERFQAIQSYR